MRKRLTEAFPWLLPIRQKQRKFCFYLKMQFDRNSYAHLQKEQYLSYEIFSASSPMINPNSGFDIRYQYNKAYNLKLAAKKIDGLIIKPGETFSFWRAIKDADRQQPYKDGLSLVNGEIVGEYGGGLCQFSNLLYWIFLHTALTVTERHGHASESIPPADPDHELPAGTDATVSEGWLDLKVKNETSHIYQIGIGFDDEVMYGSILSDEQEFYDYEIYNESVRYYTDSSGEVIQEAVVMRKKTSRCTGKAEDEKLCENSCIIGYPISEELLIEKEV